MSRSEKREMELLREFYDAQMARESAKWGPMHRPTRTERAAYSEAMDRFDAAEVAVEKYRAGRAKRARLAARGMA